MKLLLKILLAVIAVLFIGGLFLPAKTRVGLLKQIMQRRARKIDVEAHRGAQRQFF